MSYERLSVTVVFKGSGHDFQAVCDGYYVKDGFLYLFNGKPSCFYIIDVFNMECVASVHFSYGDNP